MLSFFTFSFFFFIDTPTTEIYTLSLHDALPICIEPTRIYRLDDAKSFLQDAGLDAEVLAREVDGCVMGDRKSTRLNSSHGYISYAVFCLKKKKKRKKKYLINNRPRYRQ